jgi:hypothetical protein
MTDPVLSSSKLVTNLDSNRTYTKGNIDSQLTIIPNDSPEIVDRYTQFWIREQQKSQNSSIFSNKAIIHPQSELDISALKPGLAYEDNFYQANQVQINGSRLSSGIAGSLISNYAYPVIKPGGNFLQREFKFIKAVPKRVLARGILQNGGRLGLTVARQNLTRAGASATARIALQGGARAVLLGLGVGSGGAFILTAAVFIAGEYIITEFVIPEINRLMDDSKISFQHQDIKDKEGNILSQRLVKNTYKDEMFKGKGQCTILDLKDGVFTISSSDEIKGQHTLHLWDQEERDNDIQPRAFDKANDSLQKALSYSGEGLPPFTTMNISYIDSEENIQKEEIVLEKFLDPQNNILNPNYQIFGAMELTGVIRAKDSPEASQKAMEMATRHLLSTKDKLTAVTLNDDNFHGDVSLYKMYLDLYKEGLRQYRDINQIENNSPNMTELQDALNAGEQYLKTYHQNFPDTLVGLTEQIETIQRNPNGDWAPQFTQEQLDTILNYIELNKNSNPELAQTFEIIPEQGIATDQFGVESLFQDVRARRNSSATSFFETALKHRNSPSRDAWANFAIESFPAYHYPNLGTIPNGMSFNLLERRVQDLKEETQKKEELVKKLEDRIRSNTAINSDSYQNQIKNYISFKLLEHIKQKPNFLEVLSEDLDPRLKESLIEEFLNKLSSESSLNPEIKQLQNIPADATNDQIKSFYRMAFNDIVESL